MDGSVVPDVRRRLPGRGAWLHFDLECLRNAERRRAFSRAFKVQGALDVASLREHVEQHGNLASGQPQGQQATRKQVDPS
ncbi:YlxR family protein [Lentzea chajnantorensis]